MRLLVLLALRIVVVPVLSLGLGSCSNYSTLMMSEQGQVMRCASSGWGIIGAIHAPSVHDSCVHDMQKLGYFEMPDAVWGVVVQPGSQPLRVMHVLERSPAAISGIQAGDTITTVEAHPVGLLPRAHGDPESETARGYRPRGA